jgi:thioesterase domain-containing protein
MTIPNPPELELFWRRTVQARRGRSLEDIVSFNKSGSRVPVYLFPSVALGATEYLELGRYLGPDQPWHVMLPPIQKCTENAQGLVREIACHFSGRLDEIELEGRPIILGGWSAGVTLALELARQMRENGREIPLLVAIDMAPENIEIPFGRNSLRNKIKTFVRDCEDKNRLMAAADFAGTILNRMLAKFLHDRPDFITLLREYRSITPGDIAQMRRYHAAAFACPPPAPYDGKVLVIEAGLERHVRVRERWQSFASDVVAEVIEGATHSSIVRKDASRLADALKRNLALISRY